MGKMIKDALGHRMKTCYEQIFRHLLPKKTYTVIRLDGKAFNTYTRGCERPFDDGLIHDMDETAKYIAKNVQGCKLGFVQSDEITLVLTDFDSIDCEAWFKGNIQKMVSVSASMASAKFNQLRIKRSLIAEYENSDYNNLNVLSDFVENHKLAVFDSRVFIIPQLHEVYNNLIWRQQDTIRNSVSSVAQAHFSAKELHKKSRVKQLEMLKSIGIDWEKDFSDKKKYGRLIIKVENESGRKKWESVPAKKFVEDKSQIDFLAEIGKR